MSKRIVSALLMALLLVACNRDPNVAKKKYLENGNKYFERGKYKEALIMYKNALKRDQKYGEAYYRSALAEMKLGRLSFAARDLNRAVELQPENLDAYVKLANIYLTAYISDKRKPKFIVTELKSLQERLGAKFPKSYEYERISGYLALFENNNAAAIEHFGKANQLKPYEQDTVLVYMQSLAAAGRGDETEKLGYDMLKKNPKALAIYDTLFMFYLRSRRFEDADRVMRSKVDNNPKIADNHVQLAAHYFSLNDREKMKGALGRLLENRKDFPNANLLVGDFYLRVRDNDLALQNYQEGLKHQPDQKAMYQKRIVEVLVKQSKKDEAQQLVTEILKEKPDDPEAIAIRASLSMLAGTKEQLQSAINDLQTVVTRLPENPVLRFNLGRAHLAKGNVDQAKIQLEEAIKLRPDYLLPRITLAQILLQKRDWAKAHQMAAEILAYDQMNIAARLLKTRALVGMGEFKQAREDLTATAKQFPKLPEARLQLAALDLQDGRSKEAEDAFRQLYAETRDTRAFMGLIETYVNRKDHVQAMKALREELTKSPERVDYRVALANIAAVTQDHETAIGEYTKALQAMPRSADIWMRLGEVHRRKGDLQNAGTSFTKAKELAPNSVSPYLQLAMMYDTNGKRQEAKPLYEHVLRIEPDNHIALNNLAFMMADIGGDLDVALTMAQKAKQKMPHDANISDTLGWIYIKKNLSDSAIQVFKDLVAKEPGRATYRYHLGLALAQKGDKPQARKELETALKSNPDKLEESKIRDLLSKLS